MKTRAFAPFLAAVASSLGGCSLFVPAAQDPAVVIDEQHSDAGNNVAVDAGVPDSGVDVDAGPPVRSVQSDVSLFGTTNIHNLLVDPLFKAGYSGMGFIPLAENGSSMDWTWGLGYERATPTQSAGIVTLVPESGYRVLLVSQFNGGRGPFFVDVWASLLDEANVPGQAADIRVQVGEAWVGDSPGETVFQLTHISDDNVVLGDNLWFHYAATIEEDLPASSVFVITSRLAGKDLYAAGPQVIPQTLQNAGSLDRANRIRPFPATRGTWSDVEKNAIKRAMEQGPKMDAPDAMKRKLRDRADRIVKPLQRDVNRP